MVVLEPAFQGQALFPVLEGRVEMGLGPLDLTELLEQARQSRGGENGAVGQKRALQIRVDHEVALLFADLVHQARAARG